MVTSYCDSLFVGHCTAEDFIKHFYEFMNRYDFVNLDRTSVNKKFERKRLESLETIERTTFTCIGTCSLHIANNAFGGTNVNIEESCEP